MSGSKTEMVLLPGRLLFEALAAPENPSNVTDLAKRRFRAKFQTSKEAPELAGLWAAITRVAQSTWGANAQEYLENLNACIEQGIAADKSDISIQDGDLFQPTLNSGYYLIQATRPMRKGPPIVRNIEGAPASLDEYPSGGDGVLVLMSVWAMPQYKGMNFTLESIRLVIRGEPLGGGPSAEEVEAAAEAMSRMPLPRAIPGVQPRTELAATAGTATMAPPQTPPVNRPVSVQSRFGGAATVPVHHGEVMPAEPPAAAPAPAVGHARRRGLMTLE